MRSLSNPSVATGVKERAVWMLSQMVSMKWTVQQADGSHITVTGTERLRHIDGIQVMSDALATNSSYLQSHAAWVLGIMAGNDWDTSREIVQSMRTWYISSWQ